MCRLLSTATMSIWVVWLVICRCLCLRLLPYTPRTYRSSDLASSLWMLSPSTSSASCCILCARPVRLCYFCVALILLPPARRCALGGKTALCCGSEEHLGHREALVQLVFHRAGPVLQLERAAHRRQLAAERLGRLNGKPGAQAGQRCPRPPLRGLEGG